MNKRKESKSLKPIRNEGKRAVSIKNIEDLREKILSTLVDLEEDKIDVLEAGIIAKLGENVISGLKTQIEYARINNAQPFIPFLENGKDGVKLLKEPDKKED